MCDDDFYNAQYHNRVIDAKLDAKLDAIYQQERAKYGLPNDYEDYGSNNYDLYNNVMDYCCIISDRLDDLNRRISLLESKLKDNNKENKFGSPFVIVEDGKVSADTAIRLTNEQFENLMKRINI